MAAKIVRSLTRLSVVAALMFFATSFVQTDLPGMGTVRALAQTTGDVPGNSQPLLVREYVHPPGTCVRVIPNVSRPHR